MDNSDFNGWHLVVIAILVFIGLYLYSNRLDLSNLSSFSITIQMATLVIFIVQLILSLENYRQQIKERDKSYYLKYSALAQMKMNDIDKMFFNNQLLDRLYHQMYKGNPAIEKANSLMNMAQKRDKNRNIIPLASISNMKYGEVIPSKTGEERSSIEPGGLVQEAARFKAEHHASSIVFQTMADIYMSILADWKTNAIDEEDLVEWWNTFKKWLRSPILRFHWQSLSDEHHPKFRKFIKTVLNCQNQNIS